MFQCIIQQSFTNNSSLGFSFTLSTVIWKVYYRDPNGTNTWNQIADINNFDQNPVAATGEIVNSTFDAADAVGKQASVAFAFDEVGEYAVCATGKSLEAKVLSLRYQTPTTGLVFIGADK